MSNVDDFIMPMRAFGMDTAVNVAEPLDDIDITAGFRIDSTGFQALNLKAALTKQIDATWVVGDDQGGMASGATLAVDTWYAIFAVKVAGVTDVMFDTSEVCANGVANNDVKAFRRIGRFLTDGSSEIVKFFQNDDHWLFDVPINSFNGAIPATTRQNVTLTLPTGIIMEADLTASMGTATNVTFIISNPDFTDTTPTVALHDISGPATVGFGSVRMRFPTDASARVSFRVNTISGSPNAQIITKGWYDREARS